MRREDTLEIFYDSDEHAVGWEALGLWEPAIWDQDKLWGSCGAQEWLDMVGLLYTEGVAPKGGGSIIYGLERESSIEETLQNLRGRASDQDIGHVFLDSFSVIENSELSKRKDRVISPSLCQTALLEFIKNYPEVVARLTPREFEVTVARVLSEIGFTKVTLRRYSKDGGADIIAILGSSTGQDEVVVAEVKHGKQGITLAVLDRLNGVRDRIGADRALAVASGHITRDALKAYDTMAWQVAVHTFQELMAILRDSNDWKRSPGGLWTKHDMSIIEDNAPNKAN